MCRRGETNVKRGFSVILCILAMLYVMGMTVCAADAGSIRKNMVLQTNSDVELHEEPDASSAVTAALQSGTPVVISEDAKDGWCQVIFRENTGYLPITSLDTLVAQDALESEFQNVREVSILSYQEAESTKKQIASTRIWGAVIIVLVIAIFGVGIVSALKKNKNV